MPARIEDYAFLSDLSSAALLSRTGSVDWLCVPRFDSAACFCALLHDDEAGVWALTPTSPIVDVQRSYRGDSLILDTIFECDDGRAKLTDCLVMADPRIEDRGPERRQHIFLRIVEGLEGTVPMRVVFKPRFDYGAIVPWFRSRHGHIEAVGGPDALDLVSSLQLDSDDEGIVQDFDVHEGDEVTFLLSYHPSHEDPEIPDLAEASGLLRRTHELWERWAARCVYEGPLEKDVTRSLLTLKGLTYAASGGVVAAATASLPEKIGGPRNWDYRYCWLRDATFTLDALLDHGYEHAAVEWRDWLLRAVAGDPEDMQIMYGVLGERRLLEYELPLDGYEGSRPVRVGNAAHTQFQLDVYGELMDSFHSARRAGIDTPDHAWALEQTIVEHVCERWREPDEGIWEVRSGPQHFVHSKVMAWVALDRGIKAIELFGREGPLDKWSSVRDEIREDIYRRGIDQERDRFKRAYDSSELDASLLMLPLVGFVSATDPVMKNTIEAIENDLMVKGLLLRYKTGSVEDGLPPGEGAFLMCSFWLVDCLVLLGRQHDAQELFDRLRATANDLGLMSEQFDPTSGRMLGNFPQAFSHVALVTSVAALASAGAARAMRRGTR